MKIYALDPTIISILFDLTDDKDIVQVANKISETIGTVTDKAIIDFLFSKGYSKEQLEAYFQVDPKEMPEITSLLTSEEYAKYEFMNINDFYEHIYTVQLPKMSQKSKDELDLYLSDLLDLDKEVATQIMETLQKARGSLDAQTPEAPNQPVTSSSVTEPPQQPQIHFGGVMGSQGLNNGNAETNSVQSPTTTATPQPDEAPAAEQSQPETTLPQFSE